MELNMAKNVNFEQNSTRNNSVASVGKKIALSTLDFEVNLWGGEKKYPQANECNIPPISTMFSGKLEALALADLDHSETADEPRAVQASAQRPRSQPYNLKSCTVPPSLAALQ